jgi:FlaG/FlaF family flagellin (archaellin)
MFWVGTWLSSMLVLNKSLCRLAIVVVLAAALISGVGTAGGTGTLVFVDERTLELTWEQAEAGVNVTVCNMGNVSLEKLQVTLTGFNFRVNETVVNDETVLKPISITNSMLNGGVCTPVRIQATDGVIPPDPGNYTGLLVLADVNASEIVRREVTIELRPVECAVDEIVLTATRDWSFLSNASLDTSYLPLKPRGSGENLPGIGTPIGIVYSEGHIGQVYVSGEQKSQEGVVLLPIRIEGLDAVGTYSGKLALTGSYNDEGTIPVKVKVTDNIWWAISTIVFGLLISFGVLQLRGTDRQLRGKPDRLSRVKTLFKTFFSKASDDRGVLILTGVVAILTGLTQFYFGKSYGTLGDYIQLFVLGAGTYVAVNSARVASMRLLDI